MAKVDALAAKVPLVFGNSDRSVVGSSCFRETTGCAARVTQVGKHQAIEGSYRVILLELLDAPQGMLDSSHRLIEVPLKIRAATQAIEDYGSGIAGPLRQRPKHGAEVVVGLFKATFRQQTLAMFDFSGIR
ncbi:hypothetical protein M0534_13215 [Methylonatrum kenyense]|nr:hypothetical protein [Methylonatrum kenyense]